MKSLGCILIKHDWCPKNWGIRTLKQPCKERRQSDDTQEENGHVTEAMFLQAKELQKLEKARKYSPQKP